jgi:carboxypeptidase D
MMFALKYLLLFAEVIAVSSQTWHEKVAKYARKSVPRISTKDAPRAETTSFFLNNRTASKYSYLML